MIQQAEAEAEERRLYEEFSERYRDYAKQLRSH